MNRYKNSGWYKESERHALAAKGIKTGRKINYAYTPADLPNIVTQGLGTAGSAAVSYIPVVVSLGAAGYTVKKGKQILKDAGIDFYKITSVSDKSKLNDIQQEINRRLAEKGYKVFVSIDGSAISLSDIRVSEERVQEQGHNLQYSPYTKSGHRKTRALSWDDWVEVNDTVNDVLDNAGVSANVKSLGGKFDIRDKDEGRRTEDDWSPLAGENVGSMMNPVARQDYISRPEPKEGTQFGIMGKEGKVTKSMNININKVKSDDPLAYSYGYFQAKSGQPMAKDEDLAPEYIRGYKDAKAGKPIDQAKKSKKVTDYMLGASYPTKKSLKENIGKPLRYVETSAFGPEYKSDGSFSVVGPSPYDRKWFARITMKDGVIQKVE